ncbi:MAG: CHAT domain-containing protein, partial [Acidobacteriota bacterium]
NDLKFLNLRKTKAFRAEPGGRRLYALLFGAFHDCLSSKIRKLIIVPDGELFYLPIESLILNSEIGTSRSGFLVDRFETSYAPSATVLARVMSRKNDRPRDKDLLAVVVPDAPEAAKSFLGFPLNLPRLRHVSQEIKVISRFFDPGKRTILDGSQAEEGSLKKMDLSAYRFVHFAAHGVFDDDHWGGSGLLLRAGENHDDDGILQARDIFTLKLHSDLVTLSACQTGRGRLESGEGLVGLASALLFAGSRAVLVSLWPISDRSTPDFMEYFYAGLTKGESPSRALQGAKVKMIASSYRHPYHWAGLILVGDSLSHSISK